MALPLLAMLGLSAGSKGLDWMQGQHAYRKAKKQRHKYRDMLGALVQSKYKSGEKELTKAGEKAKGAMRSSMRMSGTYGGEATAKATGDIEMDVGERLAKLKSGLEQWGLGEYYGSPSPMPAPFDFGGAMMGGLAMHELSRPGADKMGVDKTGLGGITASGGAGAPMGVSDPFKLRLSDLFR